MVKKKQKQMQPQITKELRLELEGKLMVRTNLIRYVELRVDQETENKKEMLKSGESYHGILPSIIDSLRRMKEDTYWGEDTTANIEIQLK